MNFSISSSDHHRRYAKGLLIVVFAPIFGLFLIGVYLQPLFGDLTRIGSYAERDFGWGGSQVEFLRPLSTFGSYDHYYDVAVLGDSFSTGRATFHWQNYFVAKTGVSLVTLDINRVDLDAMLDGERFRLHPPQLFILQSVERELPKRFSRKVPCREAVPSSIHPPPPQTRLPLNSRPVADLTRRVERSISWSDVKLGYVVSYLGRRLFQPPDPSVVKVELSGEAPFSSRNRHSMLVYKDDLSKVLWWKEMGLAELACRIEATRRRVESNGKTKFLLLVAPDKLTAYEAFVADPQLRDLSRLASLAARMPAVMPRVDRALGAAIDSGVTDVYLPDDTHWGMAGYRIASDTIVSFVNGGGADGFGGEPAPRGNDQRR